MILRRLAAPVLLLTVLAPASALAAGSPAVPTASAAAQEVYFYQLGSGPALQEPRKVFTAFSSSPTFRKLQWKKWGTKHAVATGRLDNTCGACSGGSFAATVYFNGFKTCEMGGKTIYAGGRGVYVDHGEKKTIKLYSNCPH